MTACEFCGGLCCRGFHLRRPKVWSKDYWLWIALHGQMLSDGTVELQMPCRVWEKGRCKIYDRRPEVCRNFKVAGPSCEYVVKKFAPHKWDKIQELSN